MRTMGCTLTIAAVLLSTSASAQALRPPLNCLLASSPTSEFSGTDVATTTGVAPLDHFIIGESTRLMNTFRVVPQLFFLMEGETFNAYASPVGTPPFSQGTVYLGKQLLLHEMTASDRGFPAIVGILAHEFAHLLQFKTDGAVRGSAETELHADYLAGYYLGRQRYELPSDVDLFARSLFLFGDPPAYYYEPDHGNGDQRVAAMLAGYHAASLTLANAYRQGLVRAHELLGSAEIEPGLGELADEKQDEVASAALRKSASPLQFHLDVTDPYVRYRYTYRNTSELPMIVKVIIESRVVPVTGEESESEDQDGRPLTHRTIQFRLAPGASRQVAGQIRSTGQSTVVRAIVVPREVVVFERNLLAGSDGREAPQP